MFDMPAATATPPHAAKFLQLAQPVQKVIEPVTHQFECFPDWL
jgi:hypothetical protein